jgi:hypothetical protein
MLAIDCNYSRSVHFTTMRLVIQRSSRINVLIRLITNFLTNWHERWPLGLAHYALGEKSILAAQSQLDSGEWSRKWGARNPAHCQILKPAKKEHYINMWVTAFSYNLTVKQIKKAIVEKSSSISVFNGRWRTITRADVFIKTTDHTCLILKLLCRILFAVESDTRYACKSIMFLFYLVSFSHK